MIEKNVYDFKTEIKTGIMYTIYTRLGLINDVDFSLLDDNTLDAYLEGSMIALVDTKRKNKYEKWYVCLLFDGKGFRACIAHKNKEKLKELLVYAMIDYKNPKYSIVEV